MTDLYKSHARSLTAPPEHGAAIVPAMPPALGHVTRAIYVGGGGHLALRLLGGEAITLVNVPAGHAYPAARGPGFRGRDHRHRPGGPLVIQLALAIPAWRRTPGSATPPPSRPKSRLDPSELPLQSRFRSA